MSGKTTGEWTTDGEKIVAEANLARVRDYLEETDCVVVEHWHYRGARSPTRLVFDDFENFQEYLTEQTSPGDAIDVYPFPRDKPTIARGKCPDDRGRVPRGGSY